MNSVLGHDSVLQGYTGPETIWANEINFVMNRTSGAGSIAGPVGQVRATTVRRKPPVSSTMVFNYFHYFTQCQKCRGNVIRGRYVQWVAQRGHHVNRLFRFTRKLCTKFRIL